MKKSISLLSILALGACVYGTPVNNEGLYSNMTLENVDWSKVNKKGYSCQTNLFGIIPLGDNSVPTAIKKAKIQKLSYIDTDYTVYFPLMSRECTNVWGIGGDVIVEQKSSSVSDYAIPTQSEPVSTDNKDKKTTKKTGKK